MFESNPTEALKKAFHKFVFYSFLSLFFIRLFVCFGYCDRVDRDFVSHCKRNGTTDGTTAIVALIQNRNIYVANAGDSRGMIVQRGGRVVPLSIDHKPSR